MKFDANAPDFHTILERVRYEPDTGHFYAVKQAGKRTVGSRLGYPDALGYWKLFIKGRWLMAHRLAWALMNGCQWPAGEIDHINGDPSDNGIANLRVADRSQNVANKKRSPSNTTGFRGVCRIPRKRGPDRFQAQVRKDGAAIYLGTFDTPEEAHAAYVSAAEEVHGEYFPKDAEFVSSPAPKAEQLTLLGAE